MASSGCTFEHQQTNSSDPAWPTFDRGKQPVEMAEWEEHPLMSNIRNTVLTHRMQSPSHFDLKIEVKQAFQTEKTRLTRGFELNVAFCGFLFVDYFICRSVFRKSHQTKKRVATNLVQILDASSDRFIPLQTFLGIKYPVYPHSVGDSEMRAWWAGNGKVFDWMGLPTELKEQIIESCLDRPSSQWDHQRNKRCHSKHQLTRRFEPGVYEIVDRLTDWAALLGVSHQVRAITLRLFFVGVFGGFGIVARSVRGLHSVLNRLGRHYQLNDPDSLPTDYITQAKAQCYYHHPRIYPQLKQYATFRHGLRQIYLEMGFIDYMHFFEVTTGGFERYLDPGEISYKVFEQLPHVKKITLRLPRRPRQGWVDNPFQKGPQLFHYEFPCARTLHRVIYERIAGVLTLYPHVKVKGFGDEGERDRFYALRQSSMKNSTWTAADYQELYEECGGGVELGEMVQPGSWIEEVEEEKEEQQGGSDEAEGGIPNRVVVAPPNAFFPPKCRCDTKCHMLYLELEKTRERRG
jgi:hypothetical protein